MFEALCHDIDKAVIFAEEYGSNKAGIVIPVQQAKMLSAFLKSCQMLRGTTAVAIRDMIDLEKMDCLYRIVRDDVITKIIHKALENNDNVLWETRSDEQLDSLIYEGTMIVTNPSIFCKEENDDGTKRIKEKSIKKFN